MRTITYFFGPALVLAFSFSAKAQWAGGTGTTGPIDRSGNVRIGSNSAPLTLFEVKNGDAFFSYASHTVSIASPNGESGMTMFESGTRADVRFNGGRLGLFVNTSGTTPPTKGLEIDGGGNVRVTANCTVNNSLQVSGNAGITNDASVNNNLTVGGLSTFNKTASFIRDANIGTSLTVGGISTFNNTAFFQSASMATNLSVGGSASFNSASVSGGLFVGGNSTVNGASMFNNTSTFNGLSTFNNNVQITGNVGINTSPAYTFHSKGNAAFQSNGNPITLSIIESGGIAYPYASSAQAALYAERVIPGSQGVVAIASNTGLQAIAFPLSQESAPVKGVSGIAYGAPGNVSGLGVVGEGYSFGDDKYAIGVSGTAQFAGTNYGVYGTASNGALNYGIYGDMPSPGPGNYAGYFNGDVFTTSPMYYTSDRKFKENIQPVADPLKNIMRLKPNTYNYKHTPEFEAINLPQGQSFGFIAQELEEVFPQMVLDAVHPARIKDGKKVGENIEYKGVNYIALIPVLVAGMQEQQKQMDEKDAKLADLEQRLNALQSQMAQTQQTTGIPGSDATVSADQAMLLQNIPNPLTSSTRIPYYLPKSAVNATIEVCNMEGKILFSQKLSQQGSGSLELNTSEWAAGTYLYKLVVNGLPVDTKRMLIAP